MSIALTQAGEHLVEPLVLSGTDLLNLEALEFTEDAQRAAASSESMSRLAAAHVQRRTNYFA